MVWQKYYFKTDIIKRFNNLTKEKICKQIIRLSQKHQKYITGYTVRVTLIIAGAPFLGINGTALVNSTFTFVNKCCQAFSIAAMYFYPLTRKGEVEMQEKLDKMSFVNLEDDLIL